MHFASNLVLPVALGAEHGRWQRSLRHASVRNRPHDEVRNFRRSGLKSPRTLRGPAPCNASNIPTAKPVSANVPSRRGARRRPGSLEITGVVPQSDAAPVDGSSRTHHALGLSQQFRVDSGEAKAEQAQSRLGGEVACGFSCAAENEAAGFG